MRIDDDASPMEVALAIGNVYTSVDIYVAAMDYDDDREATVTREQKDD